MGDREGGGCFICLTSLPKQTCFSRQVCSSFRLVGSKILILPPCPTQSTKTRYVRVALWAWDPGSLDQASQGPLSSSSVWLTLLLRSTCYAVGADRLVPASFCCPSVIIVNPNGMSDFWFRASCCLTVTNFWAMEKRRACSFCYCGSYLFQTPFPQ